MRALRGKVRDSPVVRAPYQAPYRSLYLPYPAKAGE
jgi:hypothetical protein